MPLEKALIKLREARAELSYRPDQLPQTVVRVPGGKRTLAAWLEFLLKDTEIAFDKNAAGYYLFPDPELPRQKVNLYGLVMDAESGERLIGAAIQLPGKGVGTLSNEYGFYSLPLRGGRQKVRATYIGYEPLDREILLRADTTLEIRLRPARNLPSVIVRAEPTSKADLYLTDTKTSIGREEVDRLGGPGGEADPLRVARLLPGVESGADGLGGLFIRGSESGHNLVLLDGVPVYSLNHAAGLFSIFSNEAIRRMDLYKDGIPSRFGGRIGGVLDVHTRDGNLYETSMVTGTSLLAAKVTAEGPINVGTSSYLLSGRYFWAGSLVGNASENYKRKLGREGRLDYDVYDINFKANHQLSDDGRLYFSLYRGTDDYSNAAFSSDTVTVLNSAGAVFRYAAPQRRMENVRWTNTVAALRYNHIFGQRLFGNFRLSLSDLSVDAAYERSDSLNQTTNGIFDGDVFSGRYGSDITQLGAAFDGQYSLLSGGNVRFGLEANRHMFTPQLSSGEVPLSFHPRIEDLDEDRTMHPWELAGYVSMAGKFGGISYQTGLRVQYWGNESGFLNFSPRLLLAGRFSPSANWRLAYDRTVQSVHLVSSTVIGLPSDTWVPATDAITPSTADQFSATWLQRLGDTYNLEVAAYYRDLRQVVTFEEGGNRTNWESNLQQGNGFARGLEVTFNRSTPKFRGWISYILAESRRQFTEEVNVGRPFNFRYGRTHGFKLAALYMPTPRFSVSATWRYGSGAHYSLSQETFLLVPPGRVTEDDGLETINLVQERNGVQLPANHRLDVNAQFKIVKLQAEHVIDFGIYNVYNRHNPIYYDIQTKYESREDQLIANRDFIQVYLAPITPTFAYRVRFGGGSLSQGK